MRKKEISVQCSVAVLRRSNRSGGKYCSPDFNTGEKNQTPVRPRDKVEQKENLISDGTSKTTNRKQNKNEF